MSSLATLRLLQVADSAFPSGAFAFSNGLETLAAEGRLTDKASLATLFAEQILPRWASFDRVFLRQAYAAAGDAQALLAIDQRCHLQSTAHSLAAASRRMGRAILSVHSRLGTPGAADFTAALQGQPKDQSGYDPVVQGLIGAGLGLSPEDTEAGALHAMAAATLSAAVRLGTLGALEAQGLLADAGPEMARVLSAPVPEHASGAALLAEIAALRRDLTGAPLFAT